MSVPKDVVWRDQDGSGQWVGMHIHHRGGIRCNTRREAVEFMRNLCGAKGCGWVRAEQLTTPTPAPRLREPEAETEEQG